MRDRVGQWPPGDSEPKSHPNSSAQVGHHRATLSVELVDQCETESVNGARARAEAQGPLSGLSQPGPDKQAPVYALIVRSLHDEQCACAVLFTLRLRPLLQAFAWSLLPAMHRQ